VGERLDLPIKSLNCFLKYFNVRDWSQIHQRYRRTDSRQLNMHVCASRGKNDIVVGHDAPID